MNKVPKENRALRGNVVPRENRALQGNVVPRESRALRGNVVPRESRALQGNAVPRGNRGQWDLPDRGAVLEARPSSLCFTRRMPSQAPLGAVRFPLSLRCRAWGSSARMGR